MTSRSLMTLNGDGEEQPRVPAPRFRWLTKVFLPLMLIGALFAFFAGSLWSAVAPVEQVAAVPVVERPATQTKAGPHAHHGGSSEKSAVVQAAGWIEPDPYPVAAAALTDGTVSEVLFLEGTAVRRGDVLARLVPEDAQLALARAEAELSAAEETWQSNITAPRNLGVAEAACRETSASLEMAIAEREGAEALLAEARRELVRMTALRASGSVSESDLTSAQSREQMQAAQVKASAARIDMLRAELERRRVELEAARRDAELRTADRLALELARVAADEARLRVARLEVRSPIDGVVMSRLVEPGSRLMIGGDNPAGAQVAQLYDPARLQVRVDVPLADAAKVGVGQQVEVVVEVLPSRVFRGRVTRVMNLADIQKNTLQVKVALDEPASELRPEMLARVRFNADSRESASAAGATAVFAPVAAVRDGTAWVVSEFDGRTGLAQRRSVDVVGSGQDGWIETQDGLLPGDLVIVSDTVNLSPGRRVVLAAGKE
ncbi:efflux RND transporter periplasmic adaptor subunit [bacterium]|nr:efflux RND transporter periplasmic adaptor subunit [bacterium]